MSDGRTIQWHNHLPALRDQASYALHSPHERRDIHYHSPPCFLVLFVVFCLLSVGALVFIIDSWNSSQSCIPVMLSAVFGSLFSGLLRQAGDGSSIERLYTRFELGYLMRQ